MFNLSFTLFYFSEQWLSIFTFTGTLVLTIFPVRSRKILYIARASLFEVASSACWHFSSIQHFLSFLQLLFIALLILFYSWLKIALFSRFMTWSCFTLSWQRSLSYRHQSSDLLWKSMGWFLYDRDLLQKGVKYYFLSCINKSTCFAKIHCSFQVPLLLSIVFRAASSLCL